MSYIKGINDIINPLFLFRGKTLQGEELCGDIEIKGKYIILKTDKEEFKNNIIDSLFNAGLARKICDYVIISEDVVIVCELKSNNTGTCWKQLKNTGKLIKYLLELVKDINGLNANLPVIKYACFANKFKGVKQFTTSDKLVFNDMPEGNYYNLPCNMVYHIKQFN